MGSALGWVNQWSVQIEIFEDQTTVKVIWLRNILRSIESNIQLDSSLLGRGINHETFALKRPGCQNQTVLNCHICFYSSIFCENREGYVLNIEYGELLAVYVLIKRFLLMCEGSWWFRIRPCLGHTRAGEICGRLEVFKEDFYTSGIGIAWEGCYIYICESMTVV